MFLPSDNNLDFKLLSLNVYGLRDFRKRKINNWISKQKADLFSFKKTYSTPEIETKWKLQRKGNLHFPHGSNHSKGVLILVKKELYLHAKNVKIDNNGRFIFFERNHSKFFFLFLANIYAPNETKEQVCFFNEITEILNNFDIEPDCNIFIGGDFNITFDTELDCSRRKPKVKDSVRVIKEIKRDFRFDRRLEN